MAPPRLFFIGTMALGAMCMITVVLVMLNNAIEGQRMILEEVLEVRVY